MRKKYLLVMIFTILFSALVAHSQSAVRTGQEPWSRAAARSYTSTWIQNIFSPRVHLRISYGERAVEGRKYWNDIDQAEIPEWPQKDEDFYHSFREVRDQRFLRTSVFSSFPRRISWLYPDDGCFVRAELMEHLLEKSGFPTGAKIFAFGDLKIKTENSPQGSVGWWYHVAIAFKMKNKVFVFDPAIEPRWPLLMEEWTSQMSEDPSSVSFSICHRNTTGPFDDCHNPKIRPLSFIEELQQDYLEMEWDRVVSMERDPKKVLGDEPPWIFFPTVRPNKESAP
jgi:hypothetical protein